MNKKMAALVCSILFAPLICADAFALSVAFSYNWRGGVSDGQSAGHCVFTAPDNRPLQEARTLIVDNNLPVGTVLFSWDYNNFLPDIGIKCNSSGITNNSGSAISPDETSQIGTSLPIGMTMGISSSGTNSDGLYSTSIPGIGLQLYVTPATSSERSNYAPTVYGHYQYTRLNNAYPDQNIEYKFSALGLFNAVASVSVGTFSLGDSESRASIRAELVKTGNISNYGALNVPGASVNWTRQYANMANPGFPNDYLAGSSIIIAAPSCILDQKDYTIEMGEWTTRSGNAPVRGNDVPVQLSMKCSGKLSNVYFKFDDAGNNPDSATEKNISLYDSGGTRINNLDVELRYNGNRVNIDGTTSIDTGSHGAEKINASSSVIYDSASSATFTANYRQDGVIQRNGNAYTGPVSGKVNVTVTYE